MAKDFDCEIYKNEYDTIKLSKTEKNIIKANMNLALEKTSESEHKTRLFGTRPMRAAAAVFLAVIIAGLVWFIPHSNNSDGKNSFRIVADAAENSFGSTELVEIYCGESFAGFMSDNGYLNKQGKADFYTAFDVSSLKIKGNNIKSITVKSNDKFCYFSLGYETDMSKFSDYDSIENSQYTRKEIEELMTFGQLYCDGFTYNVENTEGEQLIELGRMFRYVIETDRTNKEIDDFLTEYEKLEAPKYELRRKQHEKYGNNVAITPTDEEKAIDERQRLCLAEIIDRTLSDTSIDIKVNYTDGTNGVIKISTDYVVLNQNGETIYGSDSDSYSLSECMQLGYHPHIVFRCPQ